MNIITKIRDKLRNTFYSCLYDFTSPTLTKFSWDTVHTLVICKIDGKLGDTEVISPFISTIIKEFPGIKLVVICSEPMAKMYNKCLKVQKTFSCPRRPTKNELLRLSKKIGQCDMFITLEKKFRFHDFYLLHLLKPRIIAGINSDVKSINIHLTEKLPNNHICEYFEYLLTLGGLKEDKIQKNYVPLTDEEALCFASKICTTNQIALAPWGASKHRHIQDEVTIKIAKLAVQYGYQIALLIPPQANYLRDALNTELGTSNLVQIPDTISVYELTAIIKLSKAIISVDTANIHLACAYNLPIFGIYSGNTDPQWIKWGPRSNSKLISVFYKNGKSIDNLTYPEIKSSLEQFLTILENSYSK